MEAPEKRTKKIFDGRYEIIAIVGRGSCSVVYHARHVSTPSAEVALKVLLNRKETGKKLSNSDRLRKEALAMVSARHKHVVRLDDFHSVEDLAYLSMEYAPGGDLVKYTSRRGRRLSPQQGELFMSQAARALDFIHKTGIIHRDIKPENILVVNDSEIRIADFGVALLPGDEQGLDELAAGVGTMSYMAPEVLKGTSYDQKSDIYSLGVSFYELLSGTHPFEGAPLAKQLDVRRSENIPPLRKVAPHLSHHLADAIMTCMQYEPGQRFDSAFELLTALDARKSSGGLLPKKEKRSEPAPESAKQPAAEAQSSPPRRLSGRREPEAAPAAAAAGSEPGERREPPQTQASPSAAVVESAPQPAQVSEPHEAERAEPPAREERAPEPQQIPVDNILFAGAERPERAPKSPPVRGGQGAVHEVKPAKPERARKPIPHSQPRQRAAAVSRLRRKPILWLTLLACVALLVGPFREQLTAFVGLSAGGRYETPDGSPLAKFAGGMIEFPALPSGVYSGTITNLTAGQEFPLTLISFRNGESIAVLVAMEGWTPAIVQGSSSEQGEKRSNLRLASNGMVLDLTASPAEGELSGRFKNLLSGEEGAWRVKPAG